MSELHINKLDNKNRILVDCVGFKEGDVVVFIKHNGGIYMAKGNDVVGRSVVNNHRVRLPKSVSRTLNMSPGDHYALIDGDAASASIVANVRIVKLAGIIDAEGNNYER